MAFHIQLQGLEQLKNEHNSILDGLSTVHDASNSVIDEKVSLRLTCVFVTQSETFSLYPSDFLARAIKSHVARTGPLKYEKYFTIDCAIRTRSVTDIE